MVIMEEKGMPKKDGSGEGIEKNIGRGGCAEPNRGKLIVVNVRWNDGYLETFNCNEVRFGSDLLWMRLTSETNRHIPLRQVRWFSVDPESHEEKEMKIITGDKKANKCDECKNEICKKKE